METQNNKQQPLFRGKDLAVLLLVAGGILLGALSILRERIVKDNREQFVISAEARVFAKPDIANINLGVKTETKQEAAEAIQEGSKKMTNVISALKNLGIEEKDIQTVEYRLRPIYGYSQPRPELSITPANPRDTSPIPPVTQERVLTGYELDQKIQVKIKDLEKIGQAIKDATTAGANQSGDISFSIDNPEELKNQARSQAIEKAKEKAKDIANQSGLKLGKIVNVYENEGYLPAFRGNLDFAEKTAFGDASSETVPEIESGEMEISMNVSLSYEVR